MSDFVPLRFFEGFYEINPAAQIRRVRGSDRVSLNPYVDKSNGGHLYVSLSVGGKRFKKKLRTLMVLTFSLKNEKGIPEGYEVFHIDGDRTNCVMSNLSVRPLSTAQSFQLRVTEARTKEIKNGKRGTIEFQNKLDAEKAYQIHVDRAAGESVSSIARRMDISNKTVRETLAGRRWAKAKEEYEQDLKEKMNG